jgi:hypothetical protein
MVNTKKPWMNSLTDVVCNFELENDYGFHQFVLYSVKSSLPIYFFTITVTFISFSN